MIIINSTLGVYGGSATLTLRICEWAKENNEKCIVITPSLENNEIVNDIKSIDTEILKLNILDVKKGASILKKYATQRNVCVINFLLDSYIAIEDIKRISKLPFKNVLYIIHQDSLKFARSIKIGFLKRFIRKQVVKCINKINFNGALFFIDEISVSDTKDYYSQYDLKLEHFKIINLPIFCEDKTNKDEIINEGFSSKVILTVTRADFPFKAYVMGLIDDFNELCQETKDFSLKIISAGKDKLQIQNKIDKFDAKIKAKINLLDWMPYEGVKEEIRKCFLFVGMGTSVLDSAACYKPVIVSKLDSYLNCSHGLFSDYPNNMMTSREVTTPALPFIKRICSLSYLEYREKCLDSFEKVKANYDIGLNMSRIVHEQTLSNDSLFNVFDILYFKIRIFLLRHLKKNKYTGL